MTGADGGFAVTSEPGPRTLIIVGSGRPFRKDIDVVAGETVDVGTVKESEGAPG
jgi:hypothetical protein